MEDYSLNQKFANYVTKIGDTLSLGISYMTRENLGLDHSMYKNNKWSNLL